MKKMFDFRSQRGSSEGGGGGGAFLGLLVIAGLLIFGVWYFNSGFSIFRKTTGPLKPQDETKALQNGTAIIIEMTNQGFIPTVLVARPYDSITFVNHDSAAHWPISAACPELDSLRPLLSTERYGLVFTTTKSCDYYDKLQSRFKGKLTIE